jgi:hypothetical protein
LETPSKGEEVATLSQPKNNFMLCVRFVLSKDRRKVELAADVIAVAADMYKDAAAATDDECKFRISKY